MTNVQPTPPVVITLTLPEPGHAAALLIQRGELAQVRQFDYAEVGDITNAIQTAMEALTQIESNPPVITDMPALKTEVKIAPEEPPEPVIDIPLKKGVKKVKASLLTINGCDAPAVHQQGIQIAARLLAGKLWDGTTAIYIDDVAHVQRKLNGLSDKELSLFTLDDFARLHKAEDALPPASAETVVSSNQPDLL